MDRDPALERRYVPEYLTQGANLDFRSEFIGHRMYLRDLRPGTVIKDIPDFQAIDAIVNQIPSYGETQPAIFPRDSRKPSKFIEKYFREKRYIGTIGDIKLTTLLFDREDFGDTKVYDGVSFLTEFPMFSTGRGKIGELVMKASLAPLVQERSTTAVRYKVLTGKGGADHLDRLLQDSQVNWSNAQKNALRQIVGAGLPTLGKRR